VEVEVASWAVVDIVVVGIHLVASVAAVDISLVVVAAIVAQMAADHTPSVETDVAIANWMDSRYSAVVVVAVARVRCSVVDST
jgi:hypothetical protein